MSMNLESLETLMVGQFMLPGLFKLLILGAIVGIPVLLVFLVLMAAGRDNRNSALKAVGVLLALVFTIPLLFVVPMALSYQPPPVSVDQVSVTEFTTGVAGDGGIVGGEGSEWLPTVEDTHAAKVYSSSESAARELARKVARELNRLAPDDSAESVALSTSIATGELANRETIFSSFAETLRQRFLPASVMEAEMRAADEPDSVPHLAIHMTQTKTEPAAWNQEEQASSGELHCRLRWGDVQRDFTTKFTEKPWVQSFDAFRNTYAGRQFLQARGADQQDAARQAAKALLPFVQSQLDVATPLPRPAWWSSYVTDQLAHQISHTNMIVDRFTQTFDPDLDGFEYSREAILVDYTKPQLADAVNRMNHELRRHQSMRMGTALRIGGLLALICIVYVGLNAATKGYYAGVLRGTAIVLAVLAVTFLVRAVWLFLPT